MKTRCGKVMHPTVQREILAQPVNDRYRGLGIRLPRIACQLPPGHEGNHVCKTAHAEYQWWNEEANPQRTNQEERK